MAQIDNSAVIGPHEVAPSAADLAILRQYDRATHGGAPQSLYHQYPAGFYEMELRVITPANAGTKNGISRKAPWPLKIWAADLGCETAAGSAATLDVLTGSSPTSIFDAAVDVKTTAGTAVRDVPETTKAEVDYDTPMFARCIGTGAGDVVGAAAVLYVQHL